MASRALHVHKMPCIPQARAELCLAVVGQKCPKDVPHAPWSKKQQREHSCGTVRGKLQTNPEVCLDAGRHARGASCARIRGFPDKSFTETTVRLHLIRASHVTRTNKTSTMPKNIYFAQGL